MPLTSTRLFYIGLWLVLSLGCAPTVDKPFLQISIEQAALNALAQDWERYFEDRMEQLDCIGGSWAIAAPGCEVLAGGFGQRHPTDTIGVDEHTLYRIGSLSKGFAGILTAQLAVRGNIDLDDPVKKYLPDFRLKDSTVEDRVLIRHLLSHTSGLPRHAYTDLLEYGRSSLEILPLLGDLDLIASPGEIHAYQNACFALIEEVLEAATGKPYEELLYNYIFKPLEMERSSCTVADFLDCCNIGRPCSSYSNNLLKYNGRYYNAVSAGGVNSTAHEMGLWMRALLDSSNLTLPPSVTDLAFHEEVNTQALKRRYYGSWEGVEQIDYGLGWRLVERYGTKLIHHRGNVNNYAAEILLVPDENIGLCVLFNNECPMVKELGNEFLNLQDLYWQIFDLQSETLLKEEPI